MNTVGRNYQLGNRQGIGENDEMGVFYTDGHYSSYRMGRLFVFKMGRIRRTNG